MAEKKDSPVIYIKQRGEIHVTHFGLDVNLCSLALEGEDSDEQPASVEVKPQRITCESCLFIINYVRAIPSKYIR